MTTEGEQQEAVCGTCAGDPRDGDGYHAYNCPERTGRTPAPVVPSDGECPVCHHVHEAGYDVRRRAYASYDTWEGKGLSRDARESGFIYGYERGRADAESAIREPYEALVKAARVLRDAELRLISTPYEMRQSWDEANDARARAYVSLDNAFREYDARIEESLGGRKDG